MSSVFHLTNREAKRELSVELNGKSLPFSNTPKYLGITLDGFLTYRRHLESLRKKISTRVSLIRRLAGATWGAGVSVLRTATLALVYSTAECRAPVWCRSAQRRSVGGGGGQWDTYALGRQGTGAPKWSVQKFHNKGKKPVTSKIARAADIV